MLKPLATYTSRAAKLLPALLGLTAGIAATASHAVTIDPTKSLFITDKAILSQFPLAGNNGVLQQLLTTAGDFSQTPTDLFTAWSATRNQCSGQFPATRDLNGLPTECLGNNLGSPELYEAISVVNRFDLASKTGADCGEYRVAFADTGITGTPQQNFLIFEAKLPNPNPSAGIEGCRPIAEFWAALSSNTNIQDRAAKLRQFYFQGLNGTGTPVIHANNYRGEVANPIAGQIRVNQRINDFRTWVFFEFNTLRNGNFLSLEQTTTKDSAFKDFARDDSLFPQKAQAFQDAVVAALSTPNKGLLANTMSTLALDIPATAEAGDRRASPRDETSRSILEQFAIDASSGIFLTISDIDSVFNEGSSLFASRIQQELNVVNSPLLPAHILARVNALSCGGCHMNSLALGAGLEYTPSVDLEMHSLAVLGTAKVTRIQAEAFNVQQGVQTETTSDAGGGQNVGWLDAGDSMVYNAVLPPNNTNNYTITYRVASNVAGGGELQLAQPGGNKVYGTVAIPNTNGWQNWTTVSHTVFIPTGETNLAILVKKGGWNLNWFEINSITPERFAVKAPLTDVFLPERKQNLETFLNTAPCTTCNVNLVGNGDFSQGQTGWQTYQHSGTNSSTTFGGQFNDARSSIYNGGTKAWHVQYYRTGVNLEQGKTYEVSYMATTVGHLVSAQLEVAIEQNGGNYTKYAPVQHLALNPAEQIFTFQFTMTEATNPNARITFNLGKNQSISGRAVSVSVDNVSIKKMN